MQTTTSTTETADPKTHGPVTAKELRLLFPTLAAMPFEYKRGQDLAFISDAAQFGSGAIHAAAFIANVFDTVANFNLSHALAAWDSEHRAAWARACAIIAARGI